MAADLSDNLPPGFLKRSRGVTAGDVAERSHRSDRDDDRRLAFHLRERLLVFRPQPRDDCLADIFERFLFRPPLRHATRKRWTFRDEPVLGLLDAHVEEHATFIHQHAPTRSPAPTPPPARAAR